LFAMRQFVFFLCCAIAVTACQKGTVDTEKNLDEGLLEGSWCLVSDSFSSQIDGNAPWREWSNQYEAGLQPVWVFRKEADGSYSATGPDNGNVTFSYDKGQISVLGNRLFYNQKEYSILSLTKDAMEWRRDYYDNNYRASSSFPYDVHYLEEHTVLAFRKSL